MKPTALEDRHDVVAWLSLTVLVTPPTAACMWFSAEGAMMLLGIDSNSHPHGVEDWSKAIAVMIAGLLGGAVGVAVGMIPWVAAMSRVLPPKTFRKWADSSAVMRAYLDAVVRIFGASSSQP